MKKLIILIAITFALLNANAQTTDNFCDPELRSKIDEISKMGGTYLKDFVIELPDRRNFKQKPEQRFTMLLQEGNIYRFYLLSSSKIKCESELSLYSMKSDDTIPLFELKQKSNDLVAYKDLEIKKTGPYFLISSFAGGKKGCAMVLVSFISTVNNVDNTKKEDTTVVYTKVDENAKFNGGDLNSFRNYIAQNFKVDTNLLKRVTGNIFIEFVVNTKGRVESVKILRSSRVTSFDKQAFELVKSSTGWTPAKLNGVVVKQSFVLPIKFK